MDKNNETLNNYFAIMYLMLLLLIISEAEIEELLNIAFKSLMIMSKDLNQNYNISRSQLLAIMPPSFFRRMYLFFLRY